VWTPKKTIVRKCEIQTILFTIYLFNHVKLKSLMWRNGKLIAKPLIAIIREFAARETWRRQHKFFWIVAITIYAWKLGIFSLLVFHVSISIRKLKRVTVITESCTGNGILIDYMTRHSVTDNYAKENYEEVPCLT